MKARATTTQTQGDQQTAASTIAPSHASSRLHGDSPARERSAGAFLALQSVADRSDQLTQLRAQATRLSSAARPNQTAPIQLALVFTYPAGKIIDTPKDDAYYRGLNFVGLPGHSGRLVWSDPRNVAAARARLARGVRGGTLDFTQEEVVAADAVNVEQDGHRDLNPEDQEYYYQGQGMAWTTRVRTCTALAIYDPATGQSFLCHADGGKGNRANISAHLETYLEAVQPPRGQPNLAVHVFAADDTIRDKGGSYTTVLEALRAANLAVTKLVQVHPDDMIAVSAITGPQHLLPSKTPVIEALKTKQYEQAVAMLRRTPTLTGDGGVYDEIVLAYRTLSETTPAAENPMRAFMTADDLDYYGRRAAEPAAVSSLVPAAPNKSEKTERKAEKKEEATAPAKKINWADIFDDADD